MTRKQHLLIWPGIAITFFGARTYGEHLGRTSFGHFVHGGGWATLAFIGIGMVVTGVISMDNEIGRLRNFIERLNKP